MSEHPNNEINDVQPTSLRHIVGQKGVVDVLTTAIDACQMDARRFEHSLMVGPPGLGKTIIAQILSAELAADYFEVLGQSIKHPSDLNSVLLAATPGSVVFIDEAHELKSEFQTALYLALDKRRIILSGGGKSSGSPRSLPLADFALVLASTDEHCLLQPLRDRMRLLLRFTYYSVEELTTVLLQRVRALGWEIYEDLLPQIAQRARGTPRLALRILQACRRVCRAEGEHTINEASSSSASSSVTSRARTGKIPPLTFRLGRDGQLNASPRAFRRRERRLHGQRLQELHGECFLLIGMCSPVA
jgi:Holliday junction DNA helicase RuvB